MKKCMREYANVMCKNNFDTFENLILYNYTKFTKFYWLVNSYSDIIYDIYYGFIDNDTLEVTLYFINNTNINSILYDIENKIQENNYTATVNICNDAIHISLTMEERV